MFDAIFGRSVKILKILAKVQCVLAFVLAAMLCGAVHEMLKPFSQFSAIVLGLVVAVVFWVLADVPCMGAVRLRGAGGVHQRDPQGAQQHERGSGTVHPSHL